MKIVLPADLVEAIRRHGESTYPEECCGFLVTREISSEGDGRRTIVRAHPMENRMQGERRRRFIIPPEELRRFERSLEGTGDELAGFYHSHPDHPATPSTFDQDHAWPWYTYLVLAVEEGRATDLGAFELDPDDRRFHAVPFEIERDESRAR